VPDPKSPGEILSDPQFQSFPLGDQLKIMRKADPNFAAMNFKDQGTVIAKSRQKSLGLDNIGEKPKDAGFFSTLGHDIASIPGALIATGTGEPGDTRKPGIIPSIGAAQHAEFEKGREALKNKDALIEAEETIEALSHGDVSALVAQGMEEHKTGFEAFTSYIKKILIGAAILLGGYLAIPIFVAKRTARNCSKTEAEKHMTRAPFPVKPTPREKS